MLSIAIVDAVVFVIAPISCLLGWATTALLGWYDNGFTRNTYSYDSRGNLIYDGQTATGVAASSTPGLQYVYDDLNQLVRINDVAGGKTYTYTYDNRGNLRQKNEYALSTGELGTPTRTVDYGYGNADWQDQLTSYNGSAITYDAIGNPTIWYNGTQMTWQKGRQLTGINSSVSGTTMYTYDDSGLRTSKTMNGVKTEYYRSGSRLIGQKRGSNVMQFLYDANGLYGFLYNGTPHYYVYNGQGDVVRLISASGATEAMYTYDAWGKPLSVTDASGNAISDASHIANVNPIRYRGYYYDVETGFYYLQSRYYDPEVGRFINADGLVSTGQGVLGYNMYAYCGNNPVNRADPTGEFWNEIWEFAKTAAAEIGKAMEVISPAYAGCGGVAAVDGPLPFGDVIAIAGAAVLTIGAIGYGIYQAAQAPAVSIPKAEEKAEEIPVPPPASTIIYRYGGTNPGNLTPKAKDKYTGLSFSTIPMPGAAVTTIEALNATGVVYAVQDGPTHVSVRPVGAPIDAWINTGSGSIWTQAVKSVVVKWDGVY